MVYAVSFFNSFRSTLAGPQRLECVQGGLNWGTDSSLDDFSTVILVLI